MGDSVICAHGLVLWDAVRYASRQRGWILPDHGAWPYLVIARSLRPLLSLANLVSNAGGCIFSGLRNFSWNNAVTTMEVRTVAARWLKAAYDAERLVWRVVTPRRRAYPIPFRFLHA